MTMKEALRQVAITVISPNLNDIKDAASIGASLTINLSPKAMISIEISKEEPAEAETKEQPTTNPLEGE